MMLKFSTINGVAVDNHLCIGEAETRKLVRTWANDIYIEWYIIDIIYI